MTVNDQHLLTTTPDGINSYQDVPITIPKEEGKMSPTLRGGEGWGGQEGSQPFWDPPYPFWRVSTI